MKYFFCFVLLMITGFLKAQENVRTTSSLFIEGKIKKTVSFSLKEIEGFPTIFVDSVVIYNHLMERKKVMKNITGVLLKDVLAKVEIDVSGPKLLSEFYIVCIASDNYKIIFSWNEIFNTDTGKHAIIVTERDGKKEVDMDDSIAFLCTTDYTTGRRYVKGLQKILIERVQ